MKALTTLLVIGMFLMPAALADDADDVKAAVLGHFVALNAGDANAYIQYYPAETSTFADGGLLNTSTSVEAIKNGFQASVDAGFKRNIQMRHLDIRVYGNTAVTTGYGVGTTTLPDGTTVQVAYQRTSVLIKQGGQWKEVHQHRSPLRGPQ